MVYSEDLKERVVAYVNNGGKKSHASRLFHVSRTTLYRWLKFPDSKPKKPGPTQRRSIDLNVLKHLLDTEPDLYLVELAQRLQTSYTTIWRACQDLGMSRKKKYALPATR